MHSLIIDGNNLLARAFYVGSEDDREDAATCRVMTMLFNYMRSFSPTHLMVAFDAGNDFRLALRPEYKANRRSTDPEKVEQSRKFREEVERWQKALDDLFLPHVSITGVEADDVCAAFASTEGRATVVSSDHDLLQLVSDDVRVFSPGGRSPVLYGPQEVMERYGCPVEHLVSLWALQGDSGDNIQGLKGVGEKRALKALLKHDYQLEDALKELAKTEEDAERVRENVELIRLHPELVPEPSQESCRVMYRLLAEDVVAWEEAHGREGLLRGRIPDALLV